MPSRKERTTRHWDQARVIAAIQEVFPHGLYEEHDRLAARKLAQVGKRCFGSWQKALVAAGLLAAGEKTPQFKTWPRSRILETIQDRHAQGLSMNAKSNKNLAAVASKRFGSWRAAIVAAGLPSSVKIRSVRRWTREKLLQEIKILHRQGETRKTDFHKNHADVSSTARTYFGSWHQALIEAKILPPDAPRKVQRHWTKSQLIKTIRSHYKQSRSLLCTASHNIPLYPAAYSHFGGWGKALQAAGIPARLLGPRARPRYAAPEAVLSTLRLQHSAGKSLAKLRKEDAALLYAAQKYFVSWSAAIRTAGLPDTRPRTMSPSAVLEAILALKQQGHSLKSDKVRPVLRYAAKKHFNGWPQALDQAGLSIKGRPNRSRRWTRAEILREIQHWHQLGRKEAPDFRTHRRLLEAARRKFGSWNRALLAAKLAPAACLHWSAKRVINELLILFPHGIYEEYHPPIPPKLQAAARMYFGSLSKALQAAGLLRDDQRLGRERKWTSLRIIAAIQDRYIQGLPLFANRDHPLANATVRHFGGWRSALKAAGIPSAKYGYHPRQWTAAIVLERIQTGYQQGWTTMQIQSADKGLASAATRFFGSWHQTLIAAGIRAADTPPPVIEKWSSRRVLQEIRACYRKGRPRRVAGSRLYAAAERYFGGWQKALAAAGIVDNPQLRWERKCQEVIERLRVWAQDSPSLSFTQAPSPLATAACYYWGKWSSALEAAGLAEQYLVENRNRRWNQRNVLVAIQARQWHGLPLKRMYQEDMGLYKQARRYFGSWEQAILAAGISPCEEEIRAKGKLIRK